MHVTSFPPSSTGRFEVLGACPHDCPDTCGLLVEVAGGRAVAVKGDPAHPHSRGTLCAKMNHYQVTVHSPRRLTTPLLATGPNTLC